MTLADISSGNTGFADVMFLVALILFAIDVVVRVSRPANWVYDWLLISAGLASMALGWLVL